MRQFPVHALLLLMAFLMLEPIPAHAGASARAHPHLSRGHAPEATLHSPSTLSEAELVALFPANDSAQKLSLPESQVASKPNLKPASIAKVRHSRKIKSRPLRSHRGKSQKLALVLAIFLGVLGIHRFYLGFTGSGLIQMLSLGGLFIWFIVDAVRIGFGKLVPVRGPYTYRIGKQAEDQEE